MPEYPHGRGEFFAHKVVRLMGKSCAAQVIGVDGCWLVTCIGMLEDSKRYSGPVTYFTGQLLPILGMNKWDQLERARKKAVDAGWLHYEPGRKGVAARYWILIPCENGGLDDSPFDETPSMVVDAFIPRNGGESGDESGVKVGMKVGTKRGRKRGTTLPIPNPIPKECAQNPTKKEIARSQFQDFWDAYRYKKSRIASERAFLGAVKKLGNRGMTPEVAADYIADKAEMFSTSPCGIDFAGKFCPYPASWLNAGSYDDDPSAWNLKEPAKEASKVQRCPTKEDLKHYSTHSSTGFEPGYIPEEQ